MQAQRIVAPGPCLMPPEIVTCLDPATGCTAALTCLARESDGAAFWFPGDCHRPGWRACTDAERAGSNWNSPACVGDAGADG